MKKKIDPELHAAALKVVEIVGNRFRRAHRDGTVGSEHDPLRVAYEAYDRLAVRKYCASDEVPAPAKKPSMRGRAPSHPWRALANPKKV